MSRPVKVILTVLGVLALLACGFVGWLLLQVEAAARNVIWQTPDRSLTLSYFPLKDMATLYVGDGYRAGSLPTWEMTHPGGTRWIIGAPTIPEPQMLLGQAYTRKIDLAEKSLADSDYGLLTSTPMGMVHLYADATELQRENIEWQIEEACKANPSCRAAYDEVMALAAAAESVPFRSNECFNAENDPLLTQRQAEAIRVAKRRLHWQYGPDVRGNFSVCSDEAGFEVRFDGLVVSEWRGPRWPMVAQERGAVYLDPEFYVIKADTGR